MKSLLNRGRVPSGRFFGAGKQGRDLDDIRRLLGHGDLRMTRRYAKITDPHLAKAADALDGILTLSGPSVLFERRPRI